MLHAITQNKSTHGRRYLGYRDKDEARVSEEDEITSIFLGPLDFMEATPVLQFWTEVFHLLGRKVVFPAAPPIDYKFRLWPLGRPVQPDAHLTFFWADNKRFDILIEFKWHAPLSGKYQLHRQWREYLNEDERKECWHVFIAPEISAGIAAKNAEKVYAWRKGDDDRLVLVSWAQISDALSRCRGRSDGLARWAAMTRGC